MQIVNQPVLGSKRSFWLLAAFLVFVFLLGGGSRPDIVSLALLRPVAVLMCGLGLFLLNRDLVQEYRWLLGLMLAAFALVLVQLIPLPPAVWHWLPGRALLADIDAATGLADTWRPIAMVPEGAWNALYSLTVPAAVLLLGMQCDRNRLTQLLPLLIGVGLVGAVLGLLQTIGGANSPLYFYNITNNGMAVGLFSNRNHHAVFLAMLFPMLAVWLSSQRGDEQRLQFMRWMTALVALMLVPMLLVTGSRAGLIAAVVGIIFAALIYRSPEAAIARRRRVGFNWRAVGIWALGLFAAVAVSVLASRAEALQRLLNTPDSEEQRFAVWGPIWESALHYFPFGSGAGSFADIFKITERSVELSPSYLNHAHNDWLELVLTMGLPGVALLLAALVIFARAAWTIWRRPAAGSPERLARLGSVILIILALASVADYPLRTPSLASLAVIAALWMHMVVTPTIRKADNV